MPSAARSGGCRLSDTLSPTRRTGAPEPGGDSDDRDPRHRLQGHRDRRSGVRDDRHAVQGHRRDRPAAVRGDPGGGRAVTAPAGSIRSSLKHRSFRRLLTALAVSQAGDWLYNVALLAFVYERTHSAAWVAATTAVRVIPVVVLGPIGGVLADRFDRRRTMVLSDVARIGCMLGLAAVAATGLPIVLAPVLAALSTAASAPYPASAAATTPRLVPAEDLAGANSARSAVGMAAVAGGPVVGAVLLLLGSPTAAFLINAGTFAVSAIAVLSIPAGPAFLPARSGERNSVVEDVVLGARTLRSH